METQNTPDLFLASSYLSAAGYIAAPVLNAKMQRKGFTSVASVVPGGLRVTVHPARTVKEAEDFLCELLTFATTVGVRDVVIYEGPK